MSPQQKDSWIRTGLQAVMVTVLSTVIINVGSMLGEKLTLVINKLDKIEKHERDIAQIKQWHVEDSTYKREQVRTYATVQKWDYDQDNEIRLLKGEVKENKSNLDLVLSFVNKRK